MSDRTKEDFYFASAPFRSLLGVMKPLNLDDERPLRDVLPGVWPTWGEFKVMMKSMGYEE